MDHIRFNRSRDFGCLYSAVVLVQMRPLRLPDFKGTAMGNNPDTGSVRGEF